MTDEIRYELLKNEVDKSNIKREVNLDMRSFANSLKNGLGEEMKNELKNPPKPDEKAAKRLKKRRFWGKLKEDFKMFFFKKENNDINNFINDTQYTQN